ncbi:MAG TPA: hypothetical protein VM099_06950, partial [Gemmatimonadaceae bacterium]|nr:hypothetical protein [Gemmatimonadaceae bacterium]
MSAKPHHPSTLCHAALATGIVLACAVVVACNETTSPTGESLTICQMMGPTGMMVNIRESQLEEHLARGDYVTSLSVSKGSTSGDGIHFSRITDALAAARAGRMSRGETTISACRITITVAAGTYTGSVSATSGSDVEVLPLTIDVPDITLLGAFQMPLNDKGRPTGNAGAPGAPVTTITANPGLVSIKTGNALDKYAEPLIVINAHPNGPRGDGAIIQGFVLQSGNPEDAVVGGNAVWAMRARGIVVQGNQIEGGFSEPVEMRSAVGRVERNLLIGKGGSCSICMFGPGDYRVIANRQVGLSTGRLGVLIFPTIFTAVPPNVEQLVLPSEALVTATVTNNELRNHQEVPFGIGVRVAAIGPGAPDVVGMANVIAENNDLSDNRWGFVVEGGFVVANTAQRGSTNVTLRGNTLARSCQAGVLIALNSQGNAIAASPGPTVKNSSFTIDLGQDINWADTWYSHPSGSGSTLMVDGKPVENGKR